jgi:hypothetical protein
MADKMNSITYGALRVSGAKEKQTSFAVNISREILKFNYNAMFR